MGVVGVCCGAYVGMCMCVMCVYMWVVCVDGRCVYVCAVGHMYACV